MEFFDYNEEDLEGFEDLNLDLVILDLVDKYLNDNIILSELPDYNLFDILVSKLIYESNYEYAKIITDLWIEKYDYSLEVFIKKSIIHNLLGDKNKSIELLKLAISIDEFNKDTYLLLAHIFSQNFQYEDAINTLNDILNIYPEDKEILFNMGILLTNLNQFKKAIKIYEKLKKDEDWKFDSHKEIAFIYYTKGDFNRAKNYFEQCINISPYDSNLWYNLGSVYSNLGQYLKANECYQTSIMLDDKNFQAYYNYGHNLAYQGKIIEAMEMYHKALEVSIDDIDTLYNIASLYADSGNYAKGIEYFTKVIELDNSHYFAYFGRGVCYDALENFILAIKDYNYSINFYPNNFELWYAKADLLYNLGFYNEAVNCYKRALKINKQDIDCLLDYGLTCFEIDKFNDAQKAFRRIISLAPEWSEGYYQLAKIYAKKKNSDKAIKLLRKAVKIDPKKIDSFHEEFFEIIGSKEFKDYLNIIKGIV